MECQKTEFRNFVDKFGDKIYDELGDQFNESLIIVTNIVIKYVRTFVKWLKQKKITKYGERIGEISGDEFSELM